MVSDLRRRVRCSAWLGRHAIPISEREVVIVVSHRRSHDLESVRPSIHPQQYAPARADPGTSL